MNVNSHNCPNCRELVEPRYTEVKLDRMFTWYVCRKCRHSFRCSAAMNGANRFVADESPHNAREVRAAAQAETAALATLRSPCCASSWRVRDTWRDERGHFRKHVCRSCAGSFWSCVDGETLTMFNERPATIRKLLEVT